VNRIRDLSGTLASATTGVPIIAQPNLAITYNNHSLYQKLIVCLNLSELAQALFASLPF
jgi:hypothetical protein